MLRYPFPRSEEERQANVDGSHTHSENNQNGSKYDCGRTYKVGQRCQCRSCEPNQGLRSNCSIDGNDPQNVQQYCTHLCRDHSPDQGASTRIALEDGPGTTTHREVPKVGTEHHAEDQAEQSRFERLPVEERDMHVQQVLQLQMWQGQPAEEQDQTQGDRSHQQGARDRRMQCVAANEKASK